MRKKRTRKERNFPFTLLTRQEACIRQYGRCARCNEKLNDLWDEGHHVIPDQAGNRGNPQHAWMGSTINCVVLCDVCHTWAHQDGDTKNGLVPDPKEYIWSHGEDRSAHQAWVERLRQLMKTVWPKA